MKTLLLLASLTLMMPAARAADKPVFIVNAASPIKELTLSQISDYYFKKNRYWPDGTKVRFFDNSTAALQSTFYKVVLKKTPREVDLYWIGEKNFSGQSAPISAESDDQVVSSVAAIPGAIGYVSSDQTDLAGVKKVTVKGLE